MSSILDFAFSVNSTRAHEFDTVAFSNLSTLEIVFVARFRVDGTRKRNKLFSNENASVWTGAQLSPPVG